MLPLNPGIGRAAFIACLLSTSSIAITAQAAPLTGTTVVDANGAVVGTIDVCRAEIGSCLVHTQANGAWYALVVRSDAINGSGAYLYFSSKDCSGPAYGFKQPGVLVHSTVIGGAVYTQTSSSFDIWAASVPAPNVTVSSYFMPLKRKCIATSVQPTGTLYQFSKVTTLKVVFPLTIQ